MRKTLSTSTLRTFTRKALPQPNKVSVATVATGTFIVTALSTVIAELARSAAPETIDVLARNAIASRVGGGNLPLPVQDAHAPFGQVVADMGAMYPAQLTGGVAGYALADALAFKAQNGRPVAAAVAGIGALVASAATAVLVSKGASPESAAQMVHAIVQVTGGVGNGALARLTQEFGRNRTTATLQQAKGPKAIT